VKEKVQVGGRVTKEVDTTNRRGREATEGFEETAMVEMDISQVETLTLT
jgi:hypothetical protein